MIISLSASGHGLFNQGVIGFSFVSLDDVSSGGPALRESIKQSILSKWDSYPSWLQHQYKLQLDRLERSLECEIAMYPGSNNELPGTSPSS